mmetsp:Transcript_12656/g.53209  ORF Transcript_12656/g.53209 Transcript_12656/m.53209 type:complete len:210 (-) Transcript_12656:1293-1922(-)
MRALWCPRRRSSRAGSSCARSAAPCAARTTLETPQRCARCTTQRSRRSSRRPPAASACLCSTTRCARADPHRLALVATGRSRSTCSATPPSLRRPCGASTATTARPRRPQGCGRLWSSWGASRTARAAVAQPWIRRSGRRCCAAVTPSSTCGAAWMPMRRCSRTHWPCATRAACARARPSLTRWYFRSAWARTWRCSTGTTTSGSFTLR